MSRRAQAEAADWAKRVWQRGRKLADCGHFDSVAGMVMASGGDSRIQLNPITGRNYYGTKTIPVDGEISFSSTTSSNISERGFARARRSLERLFGGPAQAQSSPLVWFNDIRNELVSRYGIPGVEAILSASGTDAELIAACLFAGLSDRPITNIYAAPDEIGKGVPAAASGRHFSTMTALGEDITGGGSVEGIAPGSIQTRAIPLRDQSGARLATERIDIEVASAVEQELSRGRNVVLQVLDCSKTGLAGVSRNTARQLAAAAPERIRTLVDACQLRSPAAQLRNDLVDGFCVIVTGSKFIGGPAFSGALLLPGNLVERISKGISLAAGLSDYTAALDWPDALRECCGIAFHTSMNIGLGLRWYAALQAIEDIAGISVARQAEIQQHFAGVVRRRAERLSQLVFHNDDLDNIRASAPIIPLTVLNADGSFARLEAAQRIRERLLEDDGQFPVCHVGQPVRLGARAAIRISASANDVIAVASRLAHGDSIEQSFDDISANIDTVFCKLEAPLAKGEA